MRIDLTGAEYTLKHADTPLLRYKILEDSETPKLEIVELYKENSRLMPFGLDCTDPSKLMVWLCDRASAGRRAFTDILLTKQFVDLVRPLHIVAFARGLSLNDVYWVEGTLPTSFESVNLYTNCHAHFDETIAQISIMGKSPGSPSGGISDVSTAGMLPKAWVYRDRLYLYKSGSIMQEFGVRLMQPYSEYFAYTLATAMSLPAVPYTLGTLFGTVCSVCPLFTSLDVGFVQASSLKLPKDGGLERLLAEVDGQRAYDDMRIFDYLAGNMDRHAGNFGFLVDNATNKITSFAPIFDNGEGLYGRWVDDALEKLPVRILPPGMSVLQSLKPRHLPMLESLRTFEFEQHPRYHVADARIDKMNTALQERVDRLITALT